MVQIPITSHTTLEKSDLGSVSSPVKKESRTIKDISVVLTTSPYPTSTPDIHNQTQHSANEPWPFSESSRQLSNNLY